MKRTILSTLAILACCVLAQANVSLPKFFSDHMVIQRDMPINVWGKADKGETVKVSFNGQIQTTKADKSGDWKVTLPAMPYAGEKSYTMTVEGKNNTITFTNVALGDVWFCSGQSNMEWNLESSIDGKEEITNSYNPNIRLLTVAKSIQFEDQYDILEGTWLVSSPETSRAFSAVGYFFGKDIEQEIGVPIGLINSSWGGTNIETWTSWDTMQHDKNFKQDAGKAMKQVLKDDIKNQDRYNVALKEDIGMKQKWYLPSFTPKGWETMGVPEMWSGKYGNADGVAWYRTEIELPASAAGKKGLLSLGTIDDRDKTYVNGELVGEMSIWFVDRKYDIEAGILKAGKNVIAVRVLDDAGHGGFLGNPEDIYLEVDNKKYSLSGRWQFKPTAFNTDYNMRITGPNSFPSLLYYGMVSPMIGYNIKGAIWYQGESNDSEAFHYRTLFPNMIADWRAQWGYEFPFFWVQLANFKAVQREPQESAWAELREAQNMTLSVPNTGQAVITDIGEAFDIHPRNKKDVGHRLALNALKTAYGKDVVASGPIYDQMEIKGNQAILSFKEIETGLTTRDNNVYNYVKGFTIAGADRKFYWAKAYIDGNKVVVFSEKVPNPVAVRYAWSDNPEDNNLVNGAGLLASPFRTDSWKGITEK